MIGQPSKRSLISLNIMMEDESPTRPYLTRDSSYTLANPLTFTTSGAASGWQDAQTKRVNWFTYDIDL